MRDIKVYLSAVFRNANAEILPFDWRLTAKEFLETVDRYQKKAGSRFDLAPSRKAAEALLAQLEAFYKDVAAKKIAAAGSEPGDRGTRPHPRADQLHARTALPP